MKGGRLRAIGNLNGDKEEDITGAFGDPGEEADGKRLI